MSQNFQLNKEELQLLEEIHGLVEEPLQGGNSESVDDADADVKIESEEVIVMENCDNETSIGNGGNMDADSKKNTDAVDSTKQGLAESESQTQKQNKGGNKTPNKAMQRYTSLSDVLNDGSPAAKRLFSCGGDENRTEVLEKARKLLVRTGKVNVTLFTFTSRLSGQESLVIMPCFYKVDKFHEKGLLTGRQKQF